VAKPAIAQTVTSTRERKAIRLIIRTSLVERSSWIVLSGGHAVKQSHAAPAEAVSRRQRLDTGLSANS
jgi:hypothetical protein